MKPALDSTDPSIYSQNDILALSLIGHLIPDFFPVTGFTMSPYGLASVLNGIEMLRPKMIVELGSGLSTILISKLLTNRRISTDFVSIDHIALWQDSLKEWETDLSNVKFVTSELCPDSKNGFEFEWYNREKLNRELSTYPKIDMLIVDGPPSNKKMNRLGSFFLIENHLSESGLVVIDDAHRSQEMELIDILCTEFGFTNYAFTNRIALLSRKPFPFQFEPSLWHAIQNGAPFYRKS